MRAIRLLIVAAAFVTSFTTPGAWACSCVAESMVTGPVEAEDSFIGTPVARHDPNPGPEQSSGDPIYWTFDVDLPLRATLTEQRVVGSARSDASCGYVFEIGKRYLVNASPGEDDTLWTSICSGNQELSPPQLSVPEKT